jgi:hypothetical protein
LWVFSTAFWEVILVNQETLIPCNRYWDANNNVVAPLAPPGFRAVWRHVNTSSNRRWSVMADPAYAGGQPRLSRVGVDESL